jgi:N-acetyl-anhydromuramyl-L-alanine amidase AmpD
MPDVNVPGRTMKITECLLDDENKLLVDGVTLGELIRLSGKQHLWEERRSGRIDTIVFHYISAVAVLPGTPYRHEIILKIFCNYGVSSHFLISRRGRVFLLVPEDKKAWHCGGSIMPEPDNRQAVNEFSIGIELVATPGSGFTLSQYHAAARLCVDLENRYRKRFFYTGHDRIAGERAVTLGLRKEAKVDPGKLFDWEAFFHLLENNR